MATTLKDMGLESSRMRALFGDNAVLVCRIVFDKNAWNDPAFTRPDEAMTKDLQALESIFAELEAAFPPATERAQKMARSRQVWAALVMRLKARDLYNHPEYDTAADRRKKEPEQVGGGDMPPPMTDEEFAALEAEADAMAGAEKQDGGTPAQEVTRPIAKPFDPEEYEASASHKADVELMEKVKREITLDTFAEGPRPADIEAFRKDPEAIKSLQTPIEVNETPVDPAKPGATDKDVVVNVGGKDVLVSTEDGLASVFALNHSRNFKFCHDGGGWYRWIRGCWARVKDRTPLHLARLICRMAADALIAADPKKKGLAGMLKKAYTASSVERFAQADPRISITSDMLDRDPYLLGTPGGTVDLRTGELKPAKREDYITKLTRVTPAPEGTPHPLWDTFLRQATMDDDELIKYMQMLCGYALTGDTCEQIFLFVFGPGGNGKSVFINAIKNIMQDYAVTAAMDTFTARRSGHPTDLAMLRGARLVSSSETEEGSTWAESRIKLLTGGDEISARFMRQDFFSFRSQFKLLIVGNHAPQLRSVDDAMRRRLRIVPFTYKPKDPDKYLEKKLEAEYPAILRWMIEGCLKWQKEGLFIPKVVKEATGDYLDSQDIMKQWVEECCEINISARETIARLFQSWKSYADEAGVFPGNKRNFLDKLQRCVPIPIKKIATGKAKFYQGIQCKPSPDEPERLFS